MAVPEDPTFRGALPQTPAGGVPEGELAPTERAQDPAREEYVDELATTPSRPLTDEEEEAAERDPGRQERTYAPASERVPKPPTPDDAKLIEGTAEPVHTDEGEPLR
jgi:hypothetical protein